MADDVAMSEEEHHDAFPVVVDDSVWRGRVGAFQVVGINKVFLTCQALIAKIAWRNKTRRHSFLKTQSPHRDHIHSPFHVPKFSTTL